MQNAHQNGFSEYDFMCPLGRATRMLVHLLITRKYVSVEAQSLHFHGEVLSIQRLVFKWAIYARALLGRANLLSEALLTIWQ